MNDIREGGRGGKIGLKSPTLNSTSITKFEAVNPRRDHSHPYEIE